MPTVSTPKDGRTPKRNKKSATNATEMEVDKDSPDFCVQRRSTHVAYIIASSPDVSVEPTPRTPQAPST